MRRWLIAMLLLGLAGAGVQAGGEKEDQAIKRIDEMIAKVDKTGDDWRTKVPAPEKATFAEGKTYYADMQTNKGPIRIKLMPDVAPMHVTSFIYLTRMGFYDDLAFHRVIPGFMAQGGCPLGTGTGGPGFRIDGEYDANVKHDKPGMLSTANTGRPKTDGSQFFLTFVPTPHLNGKHTIYGEVVSGTETMKTLESFGSRSGRTSEPLRIDKVTIAIE